MAHGWCDSPSRECAILGTEYVSASACVEAIEPDGSVAPKILPISAEELRTMGERGNRCGFHSHRDGRTLDDWGARVCIREPWDDADHCVWHARETGKTFDDLPLQDEPTRTVYQPYLAGLDTAAGLDFSRWRLPAAVFTSGSLRSADFTRADLRGADFRDCNLVESSFSGADVRDADFSRVTADRADFSGVNGVNAQFFEASLDRATFDSGTLFEASFTHASGVSASFEDAGLSLAIFKQAGLEHASFEEAVLRHANFQDAMLFDTTLDGLEAEEADLSDSTMNQASLRQASLDDATLERAKMIRADLTRASLLGSSLTDATFYGATTTGLQANSETEFPEPDHGDVDVTAWEYRTMEKIAKDNALSSLGRHAFQAKKDVRRAQHFSEGNYGHWLFLVLTGGLMRYGVSWVRLLAVSGLTVIAFAVLFTVFGGVRPTLSTADPIGFFTFDINVGGWLGTLLSNVYFSAVTFTTLGYGDFQPANGVTQALAGVEAFVGAVLVALLVYVFGRRGEW